MFLILHWVSTESKLLFSIHTLREMPVINVSITLHASCKERCGQITLFGRKVLVTGELRNCRIGLLDAGWCQSYVKWNHFKTKLIACNFAVFSFQTPLLEGHVRRSSAATLVRTQAGPTKIAAFVSGSQALAPERSNMVRKGGHVPCEWLQWHSGHFIT